MIRQVWREECRSFRCAFQGVARFVASERHAWFHATATVLVIVLGAICNLVRWEWCALLVVIGVVWTAEAINTALERLADVVSPDHHPIIGQVKDIAAGAVFLASLAAFSVGVIVFAPYISIL